MIIINPKFINLNPPNRVLNPVWVSVMVFTLILLFPIIMTAQNAANPFFAPYATPYQTSPFDKIKNEHYLPAFREGIRQHAAEIEAIANSKKQPNFANTIEAFERSGKILSRVQQVFYNLLSAETNDTMQAIAEEIAPEESEHSNNIFLNEKLFERVKEVYKMYCKTIPVSYSPEQEMLLKKTYDAFVRRGANLSPEDKEKFRTYSKELSLLELQFGQNVLKETNKFQLNITDQNELSGLPENFVEAAAAKAKAKDLQGWLFDLTYPSYTPFMKYIDNRMLREKMYIAYNTKAIDGENSNMEIVGKMVNLRLKIAQLLGYEDYATYVLKKRMAENSENVYKLLNDLLEAYKPTALNEIDEVQMYAVRSGEKFKIMPWDWSYYSEKLKEQKHSVNDELTRPYFELENVKKGVFGLVNRLFGLSFVKNTEIPVYHADVEAFDVLDKNGEFIAVLYTDFHPREGKRGGAWMTEYKGQWKENGKNSRPHVSLVMNFTQATETTPALLSFDELTTFLHEFGHALHGMLANTTYESLSGTNVYRDFVELPSQLLENWASEKEFLDDFAVHYQTGEKIPEELVKKIKDAENFNVGYFCLRQLSFGFLDMAWHTQTFDFEGNVMEFEKEAWKRTQILPSVAETCMSTQFNHIFAGGYAAGYYSYKWAEVLDADAFSLFKEKGIFDVETAKSFEENILSKGGTEPPMALYKRFRGKEPSIEALLKRNGIK